MNNSDCTVVAQLHPLNGSEVFALACAGQTLLEMIGGGVSSTCELRINGDPVPRALWGMVRPKAGTFIHAINYPQGGSGNKWLRTIALVVVAYLSYGVGSGAIGGLSGGYAAAGGAAVGIIGNMAVNSLIPPPTQNGISSGNPFDQLASLTGTSNQANPNGVIPCVIGQAQFFPPHAALPYSEISGDDQYLRMMLDLGYGDLDISDIKIGDTSIDSYTDVQYEVTTTPTLFDNDVYEEALSITVDDDATDVNVRTTQANTTEISVDFQFPQGLFGVDKKGNFVDAWKRVDIQFRKVGTTTWYGVAAPTPGITISSDAMREYSLSTYEIRSNANKQLRVGIRWQVDAGQYDVQVTTYAMGWDTSVQHVGTMVWTALRSISPKPASSTGTLKLAMRIKATDQLNGIVQNLSVLAQQKIPTYDPSTGTWSANTATNNPAWVYAWLLTRCPAVVRRLDDSRLSLDDIAAWAQECDAKDFAVGFVLDSARALGDVTRDILSAGRASFGLRNGRYSAVRDIAQTVPVQMFTPRNSWGFSYSRSFDELPHALRVTFTNPEAGWQQDVRIVYADGYTSANAERFEALDLSMVIDADAAWRLGRYYLAVMRDRPTTYTFQADIEHMVCERGDLIHVAHDIIGWGVGWGRVKSVSADGLTITLDDPVDLVAGTQYVIRIRRHTNSQVIGDLVGGGGITADATWLTADITSWRADMEGGSPSIAVQLSEPLTGIAPGDLYVVGEQSRDVAKLIVQKIEPGDDLSATITAMDYSDDIVNADSGSVPAFVSSISGQRWEEPPPAPSLNIRVGTSSSDQLGAASTELGIGANSTSGLIRLPSYKQAQLARIESRMAA